MLRAVAYARFSSDLQREESIEAQLRAIRNYCDEHGYVLLATYADRGISGTTDNRPEFQRMVADATQREFDVVVIHKYDRFARNRYDSAYYKHVLKQNGVRVVSVLENLQDSPESVILESVIEGMNEYYSLNLSREVKKGLQENALACKVTGGPPPLGYSVDRSTQKYVINEHEAEAVRRIFRMYLDGYSYTEIIDNLNRAGYLTRRGQPFAKNSLYAILKNERYTGVYIYVKDSTKNPKGKYVRHGEYEPDAVIRIPGGMPAIISEDVFAATQKKLKQRQHKAARFSAKEEYLLTGKVFCGVCGSPYAGNSRKPRPDHPQYVSYRCTRRNQRIGDCKNPEINRDKLEQAVLERLSKSIFNPAVIPALLSQYNAYVEKKTSGVTRRAEALRGEIKKLERKITNAVDLMIDTGSAALRDKLKELEAMKEKLLFELSEVEALSSHQIFTEGQIQQLFESAERQLKNGTLANRRRIIDEYVDKVLVYPDKIEIHLNVIAGYGIQEVVEQ